MLKISIEFTSDYFGFKFMCHKFRGDPWDKAINGLDIWLGFVHIEMWLLWEEREAVE